MSCWRSQAVSASSPAVTPMARPLSLGARAQDPWGKDLLTRISGRPPDYETPVALLDSFITPIERFYVRCHLPVPAAIDSRDWSLRVEGDVDTPVSLTVADLRRAAGRHDHRHPGMRRQRPRLLRPPVAGIQWKKGAVGTARWTGARLADVLGRAGVKPTARFVHMAGADDRSARCRRSCARCRWKRRCMQIRLSPTR